MGRHVADVIVLALAGTLVLGAGPAVADDASMVPIIDDAMNAQRVVAAQIAASRDRQQTLFDRWRRDQHGPFPEVPDLATAQRPALDRATSELLTRLQASMCDLDASARRALDTPPSALADATHAWSIAVAALWPTPSECRP